MGMMMVMVMGMMMMVMVMGMMMMMMMMLMVVAKISGDGWGLSFPDICLMVVEKPRKNLNQEN